MDNTTYGGPDDPSIQNTPKSKVVDLDKHKKATRQKKGIYLAPIDDGVDDEPIPWLVDSLVEAGATTVFYGFSGTIKTFIMMHMALCIVSGTPFFGRPVLKGSVIFVAGEGRRGLKRRIRAWEKQYRPLTDQERSSLVCVMDEGRSATMRVLDGDGPSKMVIDLAHRIGGLEDRPLAVIFDTVSTTFGLREETNEQISLALQVIRATLVDFFGCSVIAVHHSGKDGSRGARGGYSLRCDADAMYRVHRTDGTRDSPPPTPFDWRTHTVTVSCEKMKDSFEPDPFVVGAIRHEWLTPLGMSNSLVAVEPGPTLQEQMVLAGLRADKSLLEIAKELQLSKRTVQRKRDELLSRGLWTADEDAAWTARHTGRPKAE